MGEGTTASGNYSTAMGERTTASGDFCTAMGYSTIASGDFSSGTTHNSNWRLFNCYWDNTTASGSRSTTMGYSTRASGGISTAMGNTTIASGFEWVHNSKWELFYSIWAYTWASGDNSVAIGNETTASDYNSLVLGQWNLAGSTTTNSPTEFSTDNTAFVIGNGLSWDNRGDALVVKFNGDATLAGNLNINSDARLKSKHCISWFYFV